PAFRADGICRLLILGGSQGARILSDVVPQAIATLPLAHRQRIQVTQQCRPEDIARVESIYDGADVAADLKGFFEDIPERLAWSHLVVARAGASTVAEISAFGRPAILVPLGIATDDHQSANARGLAEAGAAWVMPEGEFTPAAVAKMLQRLLLHPERLEQAAKASASQGRPKAASALADVVLKAIGQEAVSGKEAEPVPPVGDELRFMGGVL
ncbi:MAG: glycosyltransferase, partial [Alphaproteobacteria bacterium]|nr:glycosyltransferase [Alphaproteobacteria bacterium]